MVSVQSPRSLRTIPSLVVVCLLGLPVFAKYSGGTGEPNDPYRIGRANDLDALSKATADYGKHFILTDNIDLADPNSSNHKIFDRAVVAPSPGVSFKGVFDGDGHEIRHVTIRGKDRLGLFGQLGSGAQIRNLGVVDVNIVGSGDKVGGVAGFNDGGNVDTCYSTGTVSSTGNWVGGLIGSSNGAVGECYSACAVKGAYYVGGLIGHSDSSSTGGSVTHCHSTGAVSGHDTVGGLVGHNERGTVIQCHSISMVNAGSGLFGSAGGMEPGDCDPVP